MSCVYFVAIDQLHIADFDSKIKQELFLFKVNKEVHFHAYFNKNNTYFPTETAQNFKIVTTCELSICSKMSL